MPPPPDTLAATQESLLNAAREVVRSEAASVAAVAEQLDERTAAAIRLMPCRPKTLSISRSRRSMYEVPRLRSRVAVTLQPQYQQSCEQNGMCA